MGGLPSDGVHITQVYRTTTYVLSATGFSNLTFTHVLRDTDGKFDPATSAITIKKSGLYAIWLAISAGGVDMTATINVNGSWYVGVDTGYNSGHGAVMWLEEGDVVKGAVYKTASATMTLDITRPFTVVGPLR